ncbi:MAG TPA: hypothetical protein PLC42_00200 [Parachlamydiaceae bacterium]|nr:hypothetical protein [Parachlamydiaceae bacterium]
MQYSPFLFKITPENILKEYLGIPLGEHFPYINLKKKGLVAEKYPKENNNKINKQIALLQETIQFLKSFDKRLPTFKSISPQLTESSSESLAFNNSKEEDIFALYLKRCEDSINNEKIKNKSKIILCVFQNHIGSLENTTLEKFHRNNLASALEYHQTIYFNLQKPSLPTESKPNLLPKSITSTKHMGTREKFSMLWSSASREPVILESLKFEQAAAIKELDTTTYNMLFSYWFTLNLKEKKIEPEKLPPFDYDKISVPEDKKKILDHHLCHPNFMVTTLQESVIRELSKPNVDLECLGHDLDRQINYLKVIKNYKSSVLKESDLSEPEGSEFSDLIESLLEYENKREVRDILLKLTELKKNNPSTSDICKNFLNFLKAEESLLTKKLYATLLLFNQKIYMLPGTILINIFPKLTFKWGDGKEYRSIKYIQEESKIEASVKTVKTNNFDLVIKNIIIIDSNDISTSTSHIFFEIHHNAKDPSDIKKSIQRPLEHLGFRVDLINEKTAPGQMKVS